MALAQNVRQALRNGLGNTSAAEELITLINTHASGTLSQRTKGIVRAAFGSLADAAPFITAVEASSALNATTLAKLGISIGDRNAASLIAAELIA